MKKKKDPRVEKFEEFVRVRLRNEVAHGPRGTAAAIAHAIGLAPAHISNVISHPPTRDPGEDMRRRLAKYWKVGYAQLEAEALGLPPPQDAVDSEDQYPARAHARNLARQAGVSDAALELIDGTPYRGAEGWTSADWLEQYLNARKVVVPDAPGSELELRFPEAVVDEEGVTDEDRLVAPAVPVTPKTKAKKRAHR